MKVKLSFPRPFRQPQIKSQLRELADASMAWATNRNTVFPIQDASTLRPANQLVDVNSPATHISHQLIMFSEHRTCLTVSASQTPDATLELFPVSLI